MAPKLVFPWQRLKPVNSLNTPELEHQTMLEELGRSIRVKRESLGLSMRELAVETRIATPVIESLERAWLNRLPERAYLYSILKQLELRLSFPVGSLDPFLPPVSEDDFKEHRFTLGSIDVFTTWQGSWLYVLCIFASLFLLNRAFYGQRLSSQTLLISGDSSTVSSGSPLVHAGRGLVLQSSSPFVSPTSPGVLTFDLSAAHQLQVLVDGHEFLGLSLTEGSHTFAVPFPMTLHFEPPMGEDDVFYWNGQRIQPIVDPSGVLTIGADVVVNSALPRPQMAPLSP